CILLGGRVAEEIVIGEITSGAKNDIDRATKIARKMVCELGMSDEIGPISLGDEDHAVFLGRDFNQRRDVSEEIAKKIDSEIRRLIDTAYETARKILTSRKEFLQKVSKILIERETISGDELKQLIAGQELAPLPANSGNPPTAAPTPTGSETPSPPLENLHPEPSNS
ncbi:hypothetical protein HYY75_01990, partial [bacterium]|nr:hypothetical protein [bacterium]